MISTGLVGSDAPAPAEVVRRLACVQAQALGGALVSVALRTQTRDLAEVRAAIEAGSVVRTWTQRGTIHLATAEDVGWILRLTAPRRWKAEATRRAHFGVDAAMLETAAALAEAAIADRGPLSREDLVLSLAPLMTGISEDEEYGRQRHLITNLSMQGRLVQSGFVPGRDELAFTLRDASADAAVDTEAALVEWMRRYVLSHGPVTVDDAARWTGLPKTPIRSALAVLVDSGAIAAQPIADVEHFHAPDLEDRLSQWEQAAHALTLLPGFDELILGYKDRSRTLDPAHERTVVPGGNGMFKNTVVAGARVRGTWKRSPKKSGPRVILEPFPEETIDAAQVDAVARTHPAFV